MVNFIIVGRDIEGLRLALKVIVKYKTQRNAR